MEEKYKKTLEKINRKLPYLAKSQYKRLLDDACHYVQLMNFLECEPGEIYLNQRHVIKEQSYLDYCDYYLDYLGEISKKAIETYKDSNYLFYNRNSYERINDPIEVVHDFFDYFMPEANKILDDMIKKDHLILFDSAIDCYGQAFPMIELDESYLAINSGVILSDFDFVETVIHEIMHIYSSIFLKKYGKSSLLNFCLYGETISMYSEISLENFLKKERIMSENIEFDTNFRLLTNLSFFKTVYYLSEAIKQGIDVTTDGDCYTIKDDVKITEEKFPYSYDDYKNKPMSYFLYVVGNLFAYELMEKEKAGENIERNINDFLINIDSDKMNDKIIKGSFDFNLISNDIKNNNDRIKKMYKLK